MERNKNLDLIRSVAVFLVISVHFLSYTGFYENEIQGPAIFAASALRIVFITCVPLFLLLTGYLQSEKTITVKHYINLTRILVSYFVCAMLCQSFLAVVNGKEWNLKNAIVDLFEFNAVPYGWYIEMYIGLYLLMPFMNVLWHSLSIKQKELLLISLILLTSAPSIFNNFDFTKDEFIYATNNAYSSVFPDWWQGIYPIAYYYIGAFIKENKDIFVSTKKIFLGLVFQIFLWGGKFYKKSRESISVDGRYELSRLSMSVGFNKYFYNTSQ